MERKIITNSMISTFMECRKKYEYRYIKGFAPIEKKASLSFGSAAHEVLEHYFYTLKDADWAMKEFIDDIRIEIELARGKHELSSEDGLKLEALLLKYVTHYMHDDCEAFDVVDVEHEFRMPLRYASGRKSKVFDIAGKIDGIVRNKKDGKLYIVEHKTASSIDEGYLNRINIDWQVAMYAHALNREMNEPVVGVVYDILIKPLIKMKKGEDDIEYEARRAASKTGNIKRKFDETKEEFLNRLFENITDENFHREIVIFDKDNMCQFVTELNGAAFDIGNCGCYYKNTGNCNKYGVCPYMSLCLNKGCINGLENEFEIRVPHEELSEKTRTTEGEKTCSTK